MKKYRIDEELKSVMPHLTQEEYEELERSLLLDGFKGSPIIVWDDIIIDGHNRYELCIKHDILFEVKELKFNSKEEVIQWMIRAQLGRRNLSPIQRIAIAEKYRSIYTKQARQNKSANGGDKKSELKNSATPISPKNKIDVRAKLAETANVSTDTYTKGKKILDSQNEELIHQVESGEKSINKAYQEIKKQETNVAATSNELSQIQKRYLASLTMFQKDIAWLLEKDFIRDDEEVTGKIHSDLKNCLEKFRSIQCLMENIVIDTFDNNTIIVCR